MTSLSPWVRRLLAIGLLAGCTALIWSILLHPLWMWSAAAVDQMDDARFEMSRASRALTHSAEISDARVATIEQTVAPQLLPGNTDAEAVTHLQSILDTLIRERELTIDSIQAASPSPMGPLTKIPVEVRLHGTEKNVMHFLSAVEQKQPLLTTSRIVLRGMGNLSMDAGVVDSPITLEATLSGYWRNRPANRGPDEAE